MSMGKKYVIQGECIACFILGTMAFRHSIDRCYDAAEWCKRHGMKKTETVAVSGERFDHWEGNGFACFIPVK